MSPTQPIASLMFVRLFRRWAAAGETGRNPLPEMQQAAAPFAAPPELAVACASLFDLVQAQVVRPLVPECCCARELSRDEHALLRVLHHAPEAGQPLTSAAIPHGLPGAICWAAFAVRRALEHSFGKLRAAPGEERPRKCPFSPPRTIFASEARAAAAAGTN